MDKAAHKPAEVHPPAIADNRFCAHRLMARRRSRSRAIRRISREQQNGMTAGWSQSSSRCLRWCGWPCPSGCGCSRATGFGPVHALGRWRQRHVVRSAPARRLFGRVDMEVSAVRTLAGGRPGPARLSGWVPVGGRGWRRAATLRRSDIKTFWTTVD